MIRRFFVIALLAIGATVSHAQTVFAIEFFRQKTIRSPEAADIFVRWGGKGTGGCAHSRICGKQRLLGSSGRGSHEGSHRCGAGPSWNWEVIKA